jgi:hypothetical protein
MEKLSQGTIGKGNKNRFSVPWLQQGSKFFLAILLYHHNRRGGILSTASGG